MNSPSTMPGCADPPAERLPEGNGNRNCRIWIIWVLVLMAAASAHAQELEPRAYSNAPVGLNFLLAGYAYSHGDVLADPTMPLKDAKLEVHNLVLAYVRTFGLWGRSSKISVVAPYAFASGSASIAGTVKSRRINGFGDPRFRFTVNFYGAPALSIKDFAGYRQNTILGASFQITPPAGQYDSGRLLNIGTHRWSFGPDIGISKVIGSLTMELTGAVNFFSDNTDYLSGQTLEMDPVYSVQGHLLYHFKNGIWCAFGGTYYWGGQTAVNGVKGDTLQENTRLGATLSLPVNRRNSIKLSASSGVYTRTGSNFDTLGITWQYRWGGGF